ncbi:Monocarboxylate transporter 7 [Orchesella cincta]|uniref:Monocarboxylate transporter 7 n=1 Tax=Orchesella cincta TaxID=48709 RepID=A0A1D2MLB3_ORCCI|nr:Monocarboxylate transporter 7 [Orchesella cincta]
MVVELYGMARSKSRVCWTHSVMRGSAYFMVQLPDGTMERRMKMPLNVDPGVHSSFHLDQLVSGGGMTPVPTMALLPTITEAKTTETGSTAGSDASREGSADPEKKKEEASTNNNTEDNANPLPNIPEPIEEEKESDEAETPSDSTKDIPMSTSIAIPNKNNIRERRNSEGVQSTSPPSNQTTPVSSVKQDAAAFLSKSPSKPSMPPRVGSTLGSQFGSKSVAASIPRNGSAPQFNYGRSIPKNTSVPFFDKQQAAKKPTFRAVPLGSATNKGSKANLQQESQSRRGSITNTIKGSIASFMGSKIINTTTQDDDYNSMWSKQELSDGLIFSSSKKETTTEPRHIIRPMSRKDIFYSGSIVNLPEYKSQMSINSYRQSVLNIPRAASGLELDGYSSPDKQKPSVCPCLGQGAGAFKSALAQLMDFSLLANPVFLFIGISNVFGMLGFYVPFVYLIDAAVLKGVDADSAAFLLSIIGVTNTIGRVVSGMVSDLPQVNSLFMNNVCILLSGVCVFVVPFCGSSYYAYVAVAVFFGLFVSAYISLTSIILVDLLGLENLTNAFGLLILFRGSAGIVGAPLAGAVFDSFKSYDVSFYLAGGFLLISAAISFMIPLVNRCAPEKPLLQPPSQPGGFLEDIPEAAESNTNSGDLDESEEKYDQVESSL